MVILASALFKKIIETKMGILFSRTFRTLFLLLDLYEQHMDLVIVIIIIITFIYAVMSAQPPGCLRDRNWRLANTSSSNCHCGHCCAVQVEISFIQPVLHARLYRLEKVKSCYTQRSREIVVYS